MFKKFLTSSIGQKYVMAASGLSLVGFVIVHLLGNLPLYLSDSSVFNAYAEGFVRLGLILNVMEAGLLVLFVLHFVLGLGLKVCNRCARPVGYRSCPSSKGGDNRNSVGARTMAITGILLLAFLILHIWQFRLGPGIPEGYAVVIGDEQVRDLYRLVREIFANPLFAGIYALAMVLLGFHLRHGIWSAFQSLGILTDRTSALLYRVALVLALLLAAGFFFIPLWHFFQISDFL